jgi:hypothetical protein
LGHLAGLLEALEADLGGGGLDPLGFFGLFGDAGQAQSQDEQDDEDVKKITGSWMIQGRLL